MQDTNVQFFRPRTRLRGYALLAALILVALVALASVVAVQNARKDAQRERERDLLFAGEEFRKAIAHYYAIRIGNIPPAYPKKLDDLIEDTRAPVTVRHLRRIYIDPMTGQADWVLDKQGDRIIGVHSRSSDPPVRHAGFTNLESSFGSARTYADWDFNAMVVASDGSAQAASTASNTSPVSLGLGDSSNSSSQPQAPTLSPAQIAIANQCFQNFDAPSADCSDDPPPYGKDQYTCLQYYHALYEACMASWPASGTPAVSPSMTN
jgi:type II secretory pathway pseudopilin PulG